MANDKYLDVPIEIYNKAMLLSHPDSNFSTCKHCSRLRSICCICPEAKKDFNNMLQEVREVSEMNNRKEDEYSFEDFIRISRMEFCVTVNTQKWNKEMRVAAEDILIAYDQMREKLFNQ